MFLKNLDVVLIDAPCSGIGTIKRNPDVKWKLKNNDIDNYKTIQAALLEKYNSLIHKDGKLIYATCSILPSESELQIQHFLKNNPDFELVKEINQLCRIGCEREGIWHISKKQAKNIEKRQ